MRTRSEAIAANIAKRIAASRTRYKFSTLHRLALQETATMEHPLTATQIEAARKAAHDALLERIAQLERRVSELETK
jgi:hypothetical protein